MRFIDAVTDTLLGIFDTSDSGQGSWPKQTPWPRPPVVRPPTVRPKGDGTHWTDYV